MEYIVLNTNHKTPNEIVELIVQRIEELDANECR